MAITDTRIQFLPLALSSAGSTDEWIFDHTGSGGTIENTVGNMTLTASAAGAKINLVADSMTVQLDSANKHFGVNTAAPAFTIEAKDSGGAQIAATETTTPSTMLISAGTMYGFVGTNTNHEVRFITNNIYRMELDLSGNLMIPAAYTTVIGGTNTDLYIDSTGLIGPVPSSIRYKENISPITEQETEWIYQAVVKEFYFKGDSVKQIGVIAEEIEIINPVCVRYEVYKVDGETLTKLDRSKYKLQRDEGAITPNVDSLEDVEYKESNDIAAIMAQITVRRIPEGISKDYIIYSMVKELQKLNARIAALEAA